LAFLTLEDPNAKIKGSRDPLGVVPIWTAFARHVVKNLTTQSTSVRGFTILLLGRHFADRLIQEGALHKEEALDVFLRMEQLGAYVRHVAHGVEGDIRGIERVRSFLNEGKGRVQIQSNKQAMILSDQKTYGLWGLFSVPARASGLIPEGALGVTETACQFLEENSLSRLNGAERPLLKLLESGGTINTRERNSVFNALSEILSERFSPKEMEFYGKHLRDGFEFGNGSGERQTWLSEFLEKNTDLSAKANREELIMLSRLAQSSQESLSHYLDRIIQLESFLAPAGALFEYLRTKRGMRPDDVAKDIVSLWGDKPPNLDRSLFHNLLPEIQEKSSIEIAAIIDSCHRALSAGEYVDAIHCLLDWNAKVMAERKAGPWVSISENGRLDVRYPGAEELLPGKDELPSLWRNSYFIDSLKSIIRQLRSKA